MYIIIVGAGGIGIQLTKLLLEDKNHNIVVIEEDKEQCEEIARKYDVVAINADTTREETLDESEVKKADILVATTDDDATNLMVCSLAKNKGAKHLISVVNQEESKPMFMEKSVKMERNPNILMAEQLFKSIKHPNIEEYMNVGNHAEIFQIALHPDSKLSGKKFAQIGLPKKSLIIAIERDNKLIIPTENIDIYSGDKITVLADKSKVDKVIDILKT